MNIEVLYEDDGVVVINKPAGLLVHSTTTKHSDPTLVDWLLERYPDIKNVGDNPDLRPGIVHRLDKETSGVLVIAKTKNSFEFLKNQFHKREVQKSYLGLLAGVLKEDSGTISKPIGLKPGTTKRTVFTKKAKMVKDAVTQYRVRKRYKKFTLVEFSLITGRTHQIRVHAAAIHHPVVGDKLYGGKMAQKLGAARHLLHAETIYFLSENGKKVSVSAKIPDDFQTILSSLK